jgi:hypothetical protein
MKVFNNFIEDNLIWQKKFKQIKMAFLHFEHPII